MPTQCKLCGLHVPDGVTSCMMCGSKNLVPETAGQTIAPSFSTARTLQGPGEAKFGRWLWAVAISLIVAPIFRVVSIIKFEMPLLFNDEKQPFLQAHPGLSEALYFQMAMNALLAASALVLNVLFYTKRKSFPVIMVAYIAVTVLFLAVMIGLSRSIFPNADMTQSYVGLVRYLIWAGALIPYLLTAKEIEARFVK